MRQFYPDSFRYTARRFHFLPNRRKALQAYNSLKSLDLSGKSLGEFLLFTCQK